jgi:hypothetical protein
MSSESGFYAGQVGAKIRLDTGDASLVSSATTKRIIYKRPVSGTIGYWSATVEESSKLVFTTTTVLDLPESGDYLLQAYMEGTGVKILGGIAVMSVGKPITPIV